MIKEQLQLYIYYWIIGLISLIALVFLPFLGSQAGLALNLPNTIASWIVYITTKIMVAIINCLIFHCFVQQAKLNVQDNEKYKEALKILDQIKIKELKYRSPKEFLTSTYRNKGTTLFITTILSAFSLTQAILTFNAITFLTYVMTIVLGIVFGVLTMKQVEIYYTEEMYYYAIRKEKANADNQ